MGWNRQLDMYIIHMYTLEVQDHTKNDLYNDPCKDSLLPMGKVWCLGFLGILYIQYWRIS